MIVGHAGMRDGGWAYVLQAEDVDCYVRYSVLFRCQDGGGRGGGDAKYAQQYDAEDCRDGGVGEVTSPSEVGEEEGEGEEEGYVVAVGEEEGKCEGDTDTSAVGGPIVGPVGATLHGVTLFTLFTSNSVGLIEPGAPRFDSLLISLEAHPERESVHLAVAVSEYWGGVEGGTLVWWVRCAPDGTRTTLGEPRPVPTNAEHGHEEYGRVLPLAWETVDIDPRCLMLTPIDVGCTLKCKARAVRVDGVEGEVVTSPASEVIQLDSTRCR